MKARDLDELLGTTARMAIVLILADGQLWTFTSLKEETGLADGNLSVQTRKLVDARYLAAEKIQKGNRRVTAFRLTELGRKQLKAQATLLMKALGLKGPQGGQRSEGSGLPPKKKQSDNDGFQVW